MMITTPRRAAELRREPPETILLVEDDEQAAKLFSLYLAEAGYCVMSVGTGEEALEVIAERRPSAIILDILLPTINGWDLLTELKSSAAVQDIPVVIASVLDQQALGFHLGATEYLVKPVERAQLLRALHRCHRHRKPQERPPLVMIGHDDPYELESLARVIDEEGYDVVRALGGLESVILAKAVHPDVVVMDLWRSRLPWFEVVSTLRAEPGMEDVAILVLTGSGLTDEQSEELREKFRSIVLTGQWVRNTLIGAIEQALGERLHGKG